MKISVSRRKNKGSQKYIEIMDNSLYDSVNDYGGVALKSEHFNIISD